MVSVCRGCQKTISELGLQVKAGKEILWSAFSSTATTVDVMEDFLGPSGPRVMFNIELTEKVARDIKAFSVFPKENEVFLPPNISFKVVSAFNAGHDLHIMLCSKPSR